MTMSIAVGNFISRLPEMASERIQTAASSSSKRSQSACFNSSLRPGSCTWGKARMAANRTRWNSLLPNTWELISRVNRFGLRIGNGNTLPLGIHHPEDHSNFHQSKHLKHTPSSCFIRLNFPSRGEPTLFRLFTVLVPAILGRAFAS